MSRPQSSQAQPLILTIASGKGGTGKTSIAVNLAWTAAQQNQGRVVYVDADAEAPNGHLFFHPQIRESRPYTTFVPQVDQEKCILCGECAQLCRFNAIAVTPERWMVFPDLCHACGGCILICPVGALHERPVELGVIESGEAGLVGFLQARLHVGQSRSAPLVRAVIESVSEADLVIVDASPGTSCPMVEAVAAADLVILVAEPTPFGLNDLRLAVEAVESLHKPFGVVINRSGLGLDQEIEDLCAHRGAPILLRIPNDRRIAETYASGHILAEALPEYLNYMKALLERTLRYAAAIRHS